MYFNTMTYILDSYNGFCSHVKRRLSVFSFCRSTLRQCSKRHSFPVIHLFNPATLALVTQKRLY
jgi:hypothetical protein